MLHGLFCLLPALALALPLLARRYPGERVLVALRDAQPGRPRPARAIVARGRSETGMPRGGLLIACLLAERPPPLLAAAS